MKACAPKQTNSIWFWPFQWYISYVVLNTRIISYTYEKNKIWMLLRNWIPPFSQIYQILESFFLAIGLYIYHYNTIKTTWKTNFKNKTKKNKNEFLATNSISMVPVGFVCSIYVITIVSKTKKNYSLDRKELCLWSKKLKKRVHLGFWKNCFSFCFYIIFKCFLRNPEWTWKNLYQSFITSSLIIN